MHTTEQSVDWNLLVEQDEALLENSTAATAETTLDTASGDDRRDAPTLPRYDITTKQPPRPSYEPCQNFTDNAFQQTPMHAADGGSGIQAYADGRLFRDLLESEHNPNIVFISLVYDNASRSVLAMCLKNCHTKRYYVFDPYTDAQRYTNVARETLFDKVSLYARTRNTQQRGWQQQTVDPGTALAEFVINNTYSKHELVLVCADGLLYDTTISDKLCYPSSYTGGGQCCDYCLEAAEMAADVQRQTTMYACTYHAGQMSSVSWYCYAPIIVSVQCEISDIVERQVRIYHSRYPDVYRRRVTGALICNPSYRQVLNHAKRQRYDNETTAKTLVGVKQLHDRVCKQSHACSYDDWTRGDDGRDYDLDVSSQVERLVCLLRSSQSCQ